MNKVDNMCIGTGRQAGRGIRRLEEVRALLGGTDGRKDGWKMRPGDVVLRLAFFAGMQLGNKLVVLA
ncbi:MULTISPECIES: hypothetical protein [unclassified Acidovorax]|jgi:hypothetical protein|uniref:hypothetical protein n=1 Tax=unclassified Acidovorax TaxID=2684926 RepID=UPI00023FC99A|nr:hypothetical protein [Acidovorax sp. NO-1]EHL23094.1 hypothetical protein KYG_09665 [Acidovorax sp. NO-1]